MPDFAAGVQKSGGGHGLHLLLVSILLIGSYIPLRPWRRRNNREPDDTFSCPLLLQMLHVATVVVLASVRAAVVVPLQDHELAAIVRQTVRLAIAAGCGEVWRRISNLCGAEQHWDCQQRHCDGDDRNVRASHFPEPPQISSY